MKPNRLEHEKSPYLLQHKNNPVDWFPWGEEAFEKAKREEKPIFLSIGYSTCHWCHVMERESFENETIAQLLNDHYVAIKVDREERPDVDRIYMTFVQATTGSGGWPMSVFLTPDLKPFLGGTYFPPVDRYGRPGFATVLEKLALTWKNDRFRLLSHGEEMAKVLREYAQTPEHDSLEASPLQSHLLEGGVEQLEQSFEPELGGFSHAPKFPRSSALNFLLHHAAAHPNSPLGGKSLSMAKVTLDHMQTGGIYDHLGGGFHRYSVDRFWHVPHFEKMLYDQALLASTYLDASLITRESSYTYTARGILHYLQDRMLSPEGGFYSAEDADSLVPGSNEKAEGAFYLWTKQEIETLLPPQDAKLFIDRYGIREEGNAPEGSDPHGELGKGNTLYIAKSLQELASAYNLTMEEVEYSLANSQQALLKIRNDRPAPHLDDKILTAWNGLAISAFSKAALYLRETSYLTTATQTARFIRDHLFKNGKLLRSYREGASAIEGFAEDYANLIQGLIDLYDASGKIEWLQWALDLQETQIRLFGDETHGGFYSTTADDAHLLVRIKEDYDGAEPSPNSTSSMNLLRLGRLLNREDYMTLSERTLSCFLLQLLKMPSALPQMLVTLEERLAPHATLFIVGGRESSIPLREELGKHFLPSLSVIFIESEAEKAWFQPHWEIVQHFPISQNHTKAYLCHGNTCKAPVDTADDLKILLQEYRAG